MRPVPAASVPIYAPDPRPGFEGKILCLGSASAERVGFWHKNARQEIGIPLKKILRDIARQNNCTLADLYRTLFADDPTALAGFNSAPSGPLEGRDGHQPA